MKWDFRSIRSTQPDPPPHCIILWVLYSFSCPLYLWCALYLWYPLYICHCDVLYICADGVWLCLIRFVDCSNTFAKSVYRRNCSFPNGFVLFFYTQRTLTSPCAHLTASLCKVFIFESEFWFWDVFRERRSFHCRSMQMRWLTRPAFYRIGGIVSHWLCYFGHSWK